MRSLASQIEESINTLSTMQEGIDNLIAMEISTEEMTEKTEKLTSMVKNMALKKETTAVLP